MTVLEYFWPNELIDETLLSYITYEERKDEVVNLLNVYTKDSFSNNQVRKFFVFIFVK